MLNNFSAIRELVNSFMSDIWKDNRSFLIWGGTGRNLGDQLSYISDSLISEAGDSNEQ
jgi:hypothetical protein